MDYENINECRYVSDTTYQELIDTNTTTSDCIYIVHYDNVPDEIATDNVPVLEVFIGNNRISSVINLDTLPPIDDTQYINVTSLRDGLQNLYDSLDDTVEKTYIEDKLNETVDELENADPINTSAIPSNLGISNKLYLYFDATSNKYEMFIFHPKLKRFIPLKLTPAEEVTPTPTPPTPPTPSTTTLKLEHSVIVTTQQSSALNIVGEQYLFDLASMSTIKFGEPGNNIIVQGKIAFWSFDDINTYIEEESETCKFITYNNCDLDFTVNNVAYETTYHSDFEILEFKTYIVSGSERTSYFVKTNNKFNDRNTTLALSDLNKDCWCLPNRTSHNLNDEIVGYGTYGFTIIVQSVVSPESDPTNFPYGYINGKIYFTVTGKPGCTDLDDYISIISGDTTITYDSYIEAKIPFASLTEYYYAISVTTKDEVETNE